MAQLKSPHVTPKPAHMHRAPQTPNFDKEAKLAVEYDGLPPLEPHPEAADSVLFTNVARVHIRGDGCEISQVHSVKEAGKFGAVFVRDGKVVCVGSYDICGKEARVSKGRVKTIDLHGGSIAYVACYRTVFSTHELSRPALTSFGSPLALEDIQGESSTKDGKVLDPLKSDVPNILGGDGSLIRAVDGLQFSSRDALYDKMPSCVSAQLSSLRTGLPIAQV